MQYTQLTILKACITYKRIFFEEIDNNKTKWTSKNEFIPTNFMLRMMTLLMPGAFKKQTKKYLNDFKNFAENGISVAK